MRIQSTQNSQNFGMIHITKIPENNFVKIQKLAGNYHLQLLPAESDDGVRSFILNIDQNSPREKRIIKQLKKQILGITIFSRSKKDVQSIITRFQKNLRKKPDITTFQMENWAKLGLNFTEVKKLITKETTKLKTPNAKPKSPLEEFCLNLINPRTQIISSRD